MYTHNCSIALCLGLPGLDSTRRNIHPLTQKKHSPTHTHPDHRTSFINFLHLLRFTAISIYVLGSPLSKPLSSGSLWSSSWSGTLYFILHAFLHPITIFFSCNSMVIYKHILSRCLEQYVVLAGSRIKSGIEFQAIGPATENA